MSAAFSPDGTRIITARTDIAGRFWDAPTGNQLARPIDHQAGVVSAAFSPDGTRIITVSTNIARIWDVPLDKGTFEQWSTVAMGSPFVLSGIALTRRVPPPAESKPAK
jgi:WD40 repeat protein